MQIERRSHSRYKVKDDAFAIINPEPVRLVPILDIGLGGIGIYLNDLDEWLQNASKLEIMVADCSFYLTNLPFEPITNCRAFPANPSTLLDGRRCSLKFGPLSPSQKSALKYFIRYYSQGGRLRQIVWKTSRALFPFKANKYSEPSCNTGLWRHLHRPTA